MNKNLTEMVFVLDRSGSMQHLTGDTIGGFNSMIEKQKQEEGEAYVTTVLFDDQYELLHDHVNIKDIKPITDKDYYARGMTALFDAVGRTINTVSARINATSEEDKPGRVIFIITTDGIENASKEFKKSNVKNLIEHQQEKEPWTFMFLGANMDAMNEAENIGISSTHAHTYSATSAGTKSIYDAVSVTASCLRAVDYSDTASLDSINCIVEKGLENIR